MQIQAASILDLNALRKLSHVCFGSDAWSIFDLIAVLTFPDVTRFKAVDDRGVMIGFIASDPRPADGAAWISILGVDPRSQRQGIGRALIHACEAQTRQSVMKLTVRSSNQGAIALYEKEGYRGVDIWRNYYNDGENGLVMAKNLQ